MSDTLVLMLGDVMRWLRVADGAIVARGEEEAVAEASDRVVAVVPARDVTIHRATLPDLSEPQAQAAARLMIAERSAAAVETLHVSVGKPDLSGDRTMVVIDRGRMASLLVDLAALGFDPDVVLAAPMLITRPESGFVRGELGTETIMRGRDNAFIDDPVLTPVLAAGEISTLDRAALEQGLIAGITDPEVNLRQGIFAKRHSWSLDGERLRRIGRLALAVAVITLLFHIVQLMRINRAADRIEANNIVLAQAALPRGTNINDPLIQVREQLTSLRGPGGGMLPLAAGVASAANAVPNLELTSLIFDGGGTLRVTARAVSVADLTSFETQLATLGLASAAGPALVDQGRQVRDYTVSVK